MAARWRRRWGGEGLSGGSGHLHAIIVSRLISALALSLGLQQRALDYHRTGQASSHVIVSIVAAGPEGSDHVQ